MFVITNLVKDTLPRADIDERHVSFLYAFHAKQLVFVKIILESYWLCTETNEETSQPVGCGSNNTPVQHNLSTASFLS